MWQMIKDQSGAKHEVKTRLIFGENSEYQVWLVYCPSKQQWIWQNQKWLEDNGYTIP
jgi:hypothetical protein